MASRRTKDLLFTAAGLGVGSYALLRMLSRPRPGKAVYQGPKPLVFAHRGGSRLWPENTLYAFERAVAMGADVLELDIHSSSDGVPVVMHDSRVDRLTDGTGAIKQKTFNELMDLDAGYWWTNDGGKSFPYRDRGIGIPTLEEVFEAFPGMRFNIDIKQAYPSIVKPFCALIEKYGKWEQVSVGSFHDATLAEFRYQMPEVATAAGPNEVRLFYLLNRLFLDGAFQPRADSFQIPEMVGQRRLITPRFIRQAHAHNIEVHVWTVDEVEDMRRLLDWGVDGIMTDYPNRLLGLLGRGVELPGMGEPSRGQEPRGDKPNA